MPSRPINRKITLASRPQGMVSLSNFKLIEEPIPELKEGEALVRTLYLSVDPYMRGRMSNRASYIEPFELNHPINGGAVGEVIESRNAHHKKGDLVSGLLEWADYSVIKENPLWKVHPNQAPISTALGVLGMPGMTAYFGFLDIGKPKEGETVVISGAAGAVGSLVGQIAKIKGCRVVGIAGSDEKLEYLINELGFDAAVNYKKPDFAEKLKNSCPKGVDIYYDNVGGDVTDAVMQLINRHARIVICGQISMYNLDKPDVGLRQFSTLLVKSASAKGFIIFEDYMHRFSEGLTQMAEWLKQGKIRYDESVIEGLENTPKAFLGLFKGENIGKQLVKIAD